MATNKTADQRIVEGLVKRMGLPPSASRTQMLDRIDSFLTYYLDGKMPGDVHFGKRYIVEITNPKWIPVGRPGHDSTVPQVIPVGAVISGPSSKNSALYIAELNATVHDLGSVTYVTREQIVERDDETYVEPWAVPTDGWCPDHDAPSERCYCFQECAVCERLFKDCDCPF